MSACDMQTFDNVTQEVFNCLLEKAESYGIAISGSSGKSSRDGFTVTWNYDSESQTLQLQCVDSPWWAPCSVINDKMHELVRKCM